MSEREIASSPVRIVAASTAREGGRNKEQFMAKNDKLETPARPQSAWESECSICEGLIVWVSYAEEWQHVSTGKFSHAAIAVVAPTPPQSAKPQGQEMTFDQWYGNRPANRKQVSREVWHAALAHASELVRLRAERDANHHLWERERDDHLMSRDKLLAERDGLRDALIKYQTLLARIADEKNWYDDRSEEH